MEQRYMNDTSPIIIKNQYFGLYENVNDESMNQFLRKSIDDRYRTFTKYKIENKSSIIFDKQQQRYFDSPTMIKFDDDDDENIPIARCSNKTSIPMDNQLNLDETELSDLLTFTNPHRILSESMRAITSHHSSLQDFKYINDISSALIDSSSAPKYKKEHIYQELVVPNNIFNDSDENKENRMPLMPIKQHLSRIPIAIQSKNMSKAQFESKEEIKKTSKSTKPNINDLINEWSYSMPKLKELLSNTRKIPIRTLKLSSKNTEFRRLKQLLTDMEMLTSAWTIAINQCRCVLQHAQD